MRILVTYATCHGSAAVNRTKEHRNRVLAPYREPEAADFMVLADRSTMKLEARQ